MHDGRGQPKPKNPEPVAPVLDYVAPEELKSTSFFKPLIIEVFLLLFGAIVLDGGVLLRTIAVSVLAYWLITGILVWQAKHRPTSGDRVCFIIGVVLAAWAPFA